MNENEILLYLPKCLTNIVIEYIRLEYESAIKIQYLMRDYLEIEYIGITQNQLYIIYNNYVYYCIIYKKPTNEIQKVNCISGLTLNYSVVMSIESKLYFTNNTDILICYDIFQNTIDFSYNICCLSNHNMQIENETIYYVSNDDPYLSSFLKNLHLFPHEPYRIESFNLQTKQKNTILEINNLCDFCIRDNKIYVYQTQDDKCGIIEYELNGKFIGSRMFNIDNAPRGITKMIKIQNAIVFITKNGKKNYELCDRKIESLQTNIENTESCTFTNSIVYKIENSEITIYVKKN